MLFTILTLLSIPSLYYYITFKPQAKNKASFMNLFNMGNLGFASSLCKDIHLGVGKLHLSWETGNMTDLISYGIITSENKIQDAWYHNNETAICDAFIGNTEFEAAYKTNCKGKASCNLDVYKYIDKYSDPDHLWVGKYSRFYTQALCNVSDRELKERK